MAILGKALVSQHIPANCSTCRPRDHVEPSTDYERSLSLCSDCVDAVEFTDDEVGLPDGTLARRRAIILHNNPDLAPVFNGLGVISSATYRSSDGTYETVPPVTFSNAPCDGCGPALAGARHPYSVFVPAEYTTSTHSAA